MPRSKGSLNASGGINSGGKLDITTGLDLALGQSTSAIGDATLTAGRDALLNGTLVGGGNGTVNAGRDIGGGGTQAFAQAANYDAQHDIALTGAVQANVVTAVGGNNASLHDVNSATTLSVIANGNAGEGDAAITGTATAPGAVNLSGARDVSVSGTLASGTALTLAAQRDVTVSGGVASEGDLTVSAAAGTVALNGSAATNGALNVTSGLDTQLGGQITAAQQVNVQAGRDIALTGAVAGQTDGVLNAGRDINGAGSAAFAQAATLTASHDLALTGALQGATVSVTGGNNAGLGSVQAVSGNLAVTANGNAGGGDVTIGGTATALGTVALQAARDIGASGALNAGSSATIEAVRNIALADVNSAGDLTIAAASGNAGAANVTTQGNLNANAGNAIAFSGKTAAGGNASLTSGGDMTLGGGIAAQNAGTLTAGGSLNAGSVAFGTQATLNAANNIDVSGDVATNGNLSATAGDSLAVNSAQAGGAVSLVAQGHDGTGDVSVTKDVLSGAVSNVSGARDVSVGGAVTSGAGATLAAGRNLGIGGALGANADASLTATNGDLSVGGAITTTGSLNAQAGGKLALLNGGLVNGDVNATSGGDMTLDGGLFGLGVANFTAGGSINGGGALTFGKDIGINAGGGVSLGAIEDAGKLTAVSNGDMSFGAATVVADVTATSHGGSVAFNGALQSGGNVQIQAANSATVTGGVASTGTVNINGAAGNVTVGGVSSNGDATLHAGQTLTLTGSSVVAGELALSGGNVTMSGTASGSKNITVSAQSTVDAAQSTIVSSNNLQVTGANVTLGNAIVGGALDAQASNQLTLAGSNVDVVGATTLVAGAGLYNASNVLAGGNLTVSAPSVTNAANASLASVSTTTISATNFTNAGLVNGATTNVTVAGALNNTGGSLMAVNGLSINTGTLDNQNGIIFAGNPNTPSGPVTGDVSLTVNGGGGAFYNGGGQLLAQRNMGVSAVNATFDPSQGTISYGGQLSLTAGYIDVTGTWNFGGQGANVVALSGMTNSGTITGTSLLSLTTYGTFTNAGQLTGYDVTFNGALNNAANAVLHASDQLTLNGGVTNRGTIESAGNLAFNGPGDYDNQYGTTVANGSINVSTGGTVYNTGGTIIAGGNIGIVAGAVINDALQGPTQTTTQLVGMSADPDLINSIVIGMLTQYGCLTMSHGDCGVGTITSDATIGTLKPNVNGGYVGVYTDGSQCLGDPSFCESTEVGNIPQSPNNQQIALPGIDQTTTASGSVSPGVIAAGGSINITTGTLSNAGSTISAGLDINLNVQSLNNAPVGNNGVTIVDTVDQAQLNAFMAQMNAMGIVGIYGTVGAGISGTELHESTVTFNPSANAPSVTSTNTSFGQQGQIIAGRNMNLSGGSLVNGGLLYAGNNFNASAAQSFSNQGQSNTATSTQPGCAAGVSGSQCGSGSTMRGNDPTTTTFSYAQQNATVFAGNDLVIAAGQIDNTYGNLLAGHDIVIGGVGSTASSTNPAQSLNNTSGNIVAGNDITLNVSGAITNNLPPPVPVHQSYGTQEQFSGCMTAGGYKESYCEGYVDQQTGNSSVISAGNNLQVNAGSLTNIGSLIAAGNSATISVAGPVVNEAQTLNAYWHSHWVQETGDFDPDKRHDTWACGSPEECTALYGSAYTNAGGTIDPPTPVGNIAATIQAPNLSITSGGQIQNVGNVIGTSVSLTGQKLINGITTANTYTPHVNAPSQVISLNQINLPGLNLSTPHSVGSPVPTAVAGQASFATGSLGSSALGVLGPQTLLDNLPSNLQPSSTLFYYNPQAEDLALQQAALQQTGKASFIDGLTYDSTNNVSVTDQEKAILYQNALNYAEANNLQLGDALTQAQVATLSQPMLWYVEQSVPDPSCVSTGPIACPTVTALMPQVYLPQNWSAMSADGTIAGQNVTLNFNQDGSGSVLNTGDIAASNTLTVNTGTLTNSANQVNVGEIWQYLQSVGYTDTTGTAVQPGGFMSAANMDLNAQTINQIGGALQVLGSDGSVDQAATQQMLAGLQQQLGTNFTQTTVSDNLNTSFTAQGGFGVSQIVGLVFTVVVTIMSAGAATAAIGFGQAAGSTFAAANTVAGTTAGIGNATLSAAAAGFASSVSSQLTMTGSLNWGTAFEMAGVSAITAGLTNGITYNSDSGFGFATQPLAVGGPTNSLAYLAGVNPAIGNLPNQATNATADWGVRGLAMLGEAGIAAGVGTAIEGGSFLGALESSLTGELAASGAFAIGDAHDDLNNALGPIGGELAYLAAHAGLGCAASALDGGNCTSGLVGAASSAAFSPDFIQALDLAGTPLDPAQQAALAGFVTLLGGTFGALLNGDAQGAATSAQNEALNNAGNHPGQKGLFDTLGDAFQTAWDSYLSQQAQQAITESQVAAGVGQQLSPYLPYIAGGGALAVAGVLFGPQIAAACAANAVLCANEIAILSGEVVAGLNGMPAGTGAGVSSVTSGEVANASDGAGGTVGVPSTIPYQPSGAVVLQGNAPVCGPACAAMVIMDSTGKTVNLADAIGSFSNGIRTTGVSSTELADVMAKAGVANTVDTVMLPGQLNQALANGQTVVVNVNGHFVIIDSQTTVNGVSYYMIRDPFTGPRGVLASALNSAMSRGVNAIVIGKGN